MATPSTEFPNLGLIREGIHFRFKIRLNKVELDVRPLSIVEEDRITQEVIDQMKPLAEENKTTLKQSALLGIKKLYVAQTSDVGAKDWKMSELELQRLTPGELQYLLNEYAAGCDKVNPSIEQFSRQEIINWAESLKKSTQRERILIESSFHQLVGLCLHLLTTQESPEDSSPGLPSIP